VVIDVGWRLIQFAVVFALLWLASISCVGADTLEVVINEVFYDPAGRDDGLEFVELYNAARVAVCLEDWRLETGNGSYEGRWKVEWVGSAAETLGANGFFVIGEDGVRPAPDGLTALDLQNGPDGCRLTSPSGLKDVVGWGDLAYGEYYEGVPAADVPSGWSIGRDPDGRDTDSNGDDFAELSSPSPGDFNHPPFDLSITKAGLSRHGMVSGSRIDIVCRVANKGTQACGLGAVVFARASGMADSSRMPEDIASGQVSSIVVRLPNPGPGIHIVTTWHRYESDRWHENDTLATSIALHPAPIVVNEIMFDPGVVDCEWIELFNQGTSPMSIKGWTLNDHGGRRRSIAEENIVIEEGSFLVLVEDEEVFAHAHPGLDPQVFFRPVGGWPTLNDTDGPLGFADVTVIRDVFDTMIDSVAYRRRWSRSGVSVERRDPRERSWLTANWSPHYGAASGSPGAWNSVSFCLPEGNSLLKLKPSTFSPDGDGDDDLLAASVSLPRPGLVRLTIFDANGRLVKRLVDGEVIEAGRITFWDGRRGDDTNAPTGVYVVLLESKILSTDEVLRSKSPVVLIRR
jgi:hypothetical protein